MCCVECGENYGSASIPIVSWRARFGCLLFLGALLLYCTMSSHLWSVERMRVTKIDLNTDLNTAVVELNSKTRQSVCEVCTHAADAKICVETTKIHIGRWFWVWQSTEPPQCILSETDKEPLSYWSICFLLWFVLCMFFCNLL